MRWEQGIPKEPGWYWKRTTENPDGQEIVGVFRTSEGVMMEQRIWNSALGACEESDWYCGPLEPPPPLPQPEGKPLIEVLDD